MDGVETGRRAGAELVTSGSLTSGGPGRPRRRRVAVVLALAAAGLLAGGFLAEGGSSRQSVRASAPTRVAGTAGTAASEAAPSIHGPRAFAVDSGETAASVVLDAAEWARTDVVRSALQLRLHVTVRAGVEVLSTDTFTGACTGGATVDRASGVTVLRPGPRVGLAADGFTLAAPSSVDVRVILDVPPGNCIVSLVGGAERRTLGSFLVRG